MNQMKAILYTLGLALGLTVAATADASDRVSVQMQAKIAFCDLTAGSDLADIQLALFENKGSQNTRQLISQCQNRSKTQGGRTLTLKPDGSAQLSAQRKIAATNTSPAKIESIQLKGRYVLVDRGKIAIVRIQLKNGSSLQIIVDANANGTFERLDPAGKIVRTAILSGK